MSFNLRIAAQEARDRRPTSPQGSDEAAASHTPAFVRGLLLGFFAAFVVFDWVLLGGAGARQLAGWLQHLVTGR